MKLSRSILFAATALLVSHSAAAEIYKCTDEQGNTRYVDKPCAGRSVIFTPTPAPVISEDASGRMDKTKRLLRAYEAEHEEEQRAEARRVLEQQQRIKKCTNAKYYEQNVTHAGRVYRTDENGQRFDLTNEERAETEANARKEVERWCDSK